MAGRTRSPSARAAQAQTPSRPGHAPHAPPLNGTAQRPVTRCRGGAKPTHSGGAAPAGAAPVDQTLPAPIVPPVSKMELDARPAPAAVPAMTVAPVVAMPIAATVHLLNTCVFTRREFQVANRSANRRGLRGHHQQARCKDTHRGDEPSSFHSLLLCHCSGARVALVFCRRD